MNIPLYSQNDPRWKDEKLGGSDLTVGRWGCTMTCIAMALNHWGYEVDPKECNEKLTKSGGFMPSGDLIWTKVHEAFQRVHFHWRGYTVLDGKHFVREEVAPVLQRIRNLIDKGQPVLLNVDNVGNDGRPDHWVLAVGHTPTDLLIHDPDGGKGLKFSEKYGSPLVGIYGYAVLIGPGENELSPNAVRTAGRALWKAKEMQEAYYAGSGMHYKVDTYMKEIADDLSK